MATKKFPHDADAVSMETAAQCLQTSLNVSPSVQLCVCIMDLGLDNDFESDDSFFDDPKISKKPPKLSKATEKKSLEDLFGFQDEGKKPEKSPIENPVPKPKVHFDLAPSSDMSKVKTPDWLGGSDATHDGKTDSLDDILSVPSKTESKKSLDLLDILPPRGSNRRPEQRKAPSFDDILKESKAATDQKTTNILESASRRGRRGSATGVSDVLGLFGPRETLDSSKSEITTKTSAPDWLGGSTAPTAIDNLSTQKKDDIVLQEEPKAVELGQVPAKVEPIESSFHTNMSNLQAQESFLLVSLQLKKYEESLSDIRNQQHEILKKQEQQFEMFLNKYIEKQKSIEQDVLTQQERINEHIRVMALRGTEIGSSRRHDEVEAQELENADDKIIKSLKQRHEEELFLMEESYKKQIALLEKSSENLEQRLSEEISDLSKTYQEKLEKLKSQHSEEISYWTEKINSLDATHKQELEALKQNQSRIIGEVKDEFLDQLERLKEQRSRESELFSNSAELSQRLTSSLDKMGKNEEILGRLQDKVVKDYDVLSMARERSIENKEKEVASMRVALEKCREQAENDRSQLLALVQTLEQKLAEQSRNSQEERWALQQAAATMAARSASFDREVEFGRASLEREREQLKTLKETLLAEQEKITLQLTEEKLKLSAEKSRLEVTSKLVNNYEVEKVKTEAETAVQVAKELSEKLNLERSFVQKQKADLDAFRNKLMEKERELIEREEDLEEARRAAQYKSNEDKRLVQEAKYLEGRYKERLMELQAQAMSLASREKKLAEEKMFVSKERLALYTKSHKPCMLCKAEEDRLMKNDGLLLGISGTDPDGIRLRLEATEDELNSEVSREDNSGKNKM